MPITMKEWIEKFDTEEKLRKQGIETRKPVANCIGCGCPLYESPISADDAPDKDLNPLRIGAP